MIKRWSERSGISVMRKYSKRAVALGLLVSMAVSVIPTQSFAAEAASKEQTTVNSTSDSYTSERMEKGYTKVSAGYTFPEYTGESLRYKMRNVCKTENAEFTTDYGYVGNSCDDGAVVIKERGTVE